jgi:hypothetical protein
LLPRPSAGRGSRARHASSPRPYDDIPQNPWSVNPPFRPRLSRYPPGHRNDEVVVCNERCRACLGEGHVGRAVALAVARERRADPPRMQRGAHERNRDAAPSHYRTTSGQPRRRGRPRGEARSGSKLGGVGRCGRLSGELGDEGAVLLVQVGEARFERGGARPASLRVKVAGFEGGVGTPGDLSNHSSRPSLEVSLPIRVTVGDVGRLTRARARRPPSARCQVARGRVHPPPSAFGPPSTPARRRHPRAGAGSGRGCAG